MGPSLRRWRRVRGWSFHCWWVGYSPARWDPPATRCPTAVAGSRRGAARSRWAATCSGRRRPRIARPPGRPSGIQGRNPSMTMGTIYGWRMVKKDQMDSNGFKWVIFQWKLTIRNKKRIGPDRMIKMFCCLLAPQNGCHLWQYQSHPPVAFCHGFWGENSIGTWPFSSETDLFEAPSPTKLLDLSFSRPPLESSDAKYVL